MASHDGRRSPPATAADRCDAVCPSSPPPHAPRPAPPRCRLRPGGPDDCYYTTNACNPLHQPYNWCFTTGGQSGSAIYDLADYKVSHQSSSPAITKDCTISPPQVTTQVHHRCRLPSLAPACSPHARPTPATSACLASVSSGSLHLQRMQQHGMGHEGGWGMTCGTPGRGVVAAGVRHKHAHCDTRAHSRACRPLC